MARWLMAQSYEPFTTAYLPIGCCKRPSDYHTTGHYQAIEESYCQQKWQQHHTPPLHSLVCTNTGKSAEGACHGQGGREGADYSDSNLHHSSDPCFFTLLCPLTLIKPIPATKLEWVPAGLWTTRRFT